MSKKREETLEHPVGALLKEASAWVAMVDSSQGPSMDGSKGMSRVKTKVIYKANKSPEDCQS